MTDENKGRTVEFLASFPHCAGAVDHHGESGTRIKLDIPNTNLAEALQLPAFFFNKVLRVTITIES